MECLARPIKDDWRAWKLNGDVAGMVKDWDHMSLVTVKGCGHTIMESVKAPRGWGVVVGSSVRARQSPVGAPIRSVELYSGQANFHVGHV